MPVGAGKSSVAASLLDWTTEIGKSAKTIVLTPTNILTRQYLDTFPYIPKMFGKAHYWCGLNEMSVAEKDKLKLPLCQPDYEECTGCQEYLDDKFALETEPYNLMNNWVYIARGLYKSTDVLIIDEAHNLIPLLQELGSTKVWHHKLPKEYRYSIEMRSIEELRDWLETIPDEYMEPDPDNPDCPKKINLLRFKKAATSNRYLFQAEESEYQGEQRHCIKLTPIDITEEPKILFPERLKKIILMSATISRKDVEQMGLYMKRVKYINASSPIPKRQRPIIIARDGYNMSFRHQAENIPKLAIKLGELGAKHHHHKGLIHVPYAIGRQLRPLLQDNPRFLFHGKNNKAAIVAQFKESNEPIILVASGLYEGLDLPFDAARFQVVAKIPFPSLAEPAIKYKAERDQEWYSWECLKLFLQACGRVCRGPEDWGITYVLDKSINKLYFENKELFPQWTREALQWRTTSDVEPDL